MIVLQQFNDLLTNQRSNEFAAEFFREKIRETVDDPETAAKLLPIGYPIAAKRPVLDTDYFETFNKPHVHLVDVKETPITEITPTGIRVGDVEHELDVIIFATGYDAFTGSFLRIDIRGRDGVRLADRWADGPTAYLGLGIAGFPNLLTVNGPCNPAVLTNVPATIEHDVEWIADCIAYLEAARDHVDRADRARPSRRGCATSPTLVEGTLYPLADSWWMGANIPGKPRVFMAYTGGLNEFRERCAEVAAAGYEGYGADGHRSIKGAGVRNPAPGDGRDMTCSMVPIRDKEVPHEHGGRPHRGPRGAARRAARRARRAGTGVVTDCGRIVSKRHVQEGRDRHCRRRHRRHPRPLGDSPRRRRQRRRDRQRDPDRPVPDRPHRRTDSRAATCCSSTTASGFDLGSSIVPGRDRGLERESQRHQRLHGERPGRRRRLPVAARTRSACSPPASTAPTPWMLATGCTADGAAGRPRPG